MGIVDSLKGFIGIDDDDQFDDVDETYEDYDDEYEEGFQDAFVQPRRNSVTPINTAPGRGTISIIKIKSFDEAENLAAILKASRPAIFDVSEMDDPKEAVRVVDFMSGAVFGLNGSIKRVSGGIFLAVPNTMNITNDDVRRKATNSINLDI